MPPIARRALLAGAVILPADARAAAPPLRMVVPFALGGATDIAARILVPALAEALWRPVVQAAGVTLD